MYTDKKWSGQIALGTSNKAEDQEAWDNKDVEWVRAADLVEGKQPKLYEGKIEPADLVQGQLGNCWLVAPLAAG